MKRKRVCTVVLIVLSAVIVMIGVVGLLNKSRNAFVSAIGSYICENYNIVKSVKFDRHNFYAYPHCSINLYVDSNCTFDQAKELFEDLLNHFTDDFIVELREATKRKSFLNVEFIKAGTDLSIYSFETPDTEDFIHWSATRGNKKNYEFDRHID